MAVSICYQDKVILRCKNIIFELLHERMSQIVDEEYLELPSNLSDMLEKMDQNIYGGGAIAVDIADYIKNKADLKIFSNILSKSIKVYSKDFPEAPQSYRDILWNFHKELLKHGEELEK